MDNEDFSLKKLQLLNENRFLRITPYTEFRDGTKGSVLLLGFNSPDSLLFLFNSPERGDEFEHCKDNTLSPAELDCFYNYRELCIKEYDGFYHISKELYNQYGVVLLTGKYLTAHIADFFCDNLNKQRNSRTNWQTDRTEYLMADALQTYRISEMEEDIEDFLSDDSQWRREITLQALSRYNDADKLFEKSLHIDWLRVRNKYADWLTHETFQFKLYFAQRLLSEYREFGKPVDWRRLLENEFRAKLNDPVTFHYLDYGVQEIVGLYALTKYHYTKRPKYIEIQYADVEMGERINLYGEYRAQCILEMLERLKAENNPLRTEFPTEEEAEIEVKAHIAKLVGRQPFNLPDEQKGTYAFYEKGFCFSQGIMHPDISPIISESKTKAKHTAPQTKLQSEPFTPTITDLEKVFLPCYTKIPECKMLLNILLEDRKVVSDPEWARYALTIYECKKIFKNHPKSFKEWLPIFCNLFGRVVEYRAPSNIKRTKCKTDITPFLPMLNVELM